MDSLHMKDTKSTPKIHFDAKTGFLKINGVSRPENVLDFYADAIKWLEEYSKDPKSRTTMVMDFSYFNTSSLKFFLRILSCFKKILARGKEIKIIWHYRKDDTTMLEAGELLNEISEIPFDFIES